MQRKLLGIRRTARRAPSRGCADDVFTTLSLLIDGFGFPVVVIPDKTSGSDRDPNEFDPEMQRGHRAQSFDHFREISCRLKGESCYGAKVEH